MTSVWRALRIVGTILASLVLGYVTLVTLFFVGYWFKEGQPLRNYRFNNSLSKAFFWAGSPFGYSEAAIVAGSVCYSLAWFVIILLTWRRFRSSV